VLRPQLLTAVAEGGNVAVDLSGATYLASAGVGLLLEAASRARDAGGRLRLLVARSGGPARVLRLSGLADVVAVEPVEVPAG
jgi:anti-anti-sigma factor